MVPVSTPTARIQPHQQAPRAVGADGSVREALSIALTQVERSHRGRGPARTRTHLLSNYVLCLHEEVLTRQQVNLKGLHRTDLIASIRRASDHLARRECVARVEQLVRCPVVACQSIVDVELDLAWQVFVLDSVPEPRNGEYRPRAVPPALLRVAREAYGKGAARAHSHWSESVVLCVYEEPLTQTERALVDGGECELVREARLVLQHASELERNAEISRLAGRPVRSSNSLIAFDPDIAFEIYTLVPRGES